MILKKHEIEAALHAETQEISAGRLKEDNPLDVSNGFARLCEACRRGDLKVCQEMIQEGVNINARDRFDYTPLILASLCGHYEVAQLLLESGALCERDTFQGERCLYNALNDRIRNLLLSYDYSKSSDPLQPLAAHTSSLLAREVPKTSDISLTAGQESFELHKLILAARSPYFAKKLAASPGATVWKISESLAPQSVEIAIRFLYLAEISVDLGNSEEEQTILTGIGKLSTQLEIPRLFDRVLQGGDRRMVRQLRTDELSQGQSQLDTWFRDHVLENRVTLDMEKASSVKWDRNNSVFADVLLRADEDAEIEEDDLSSPLAATSPSEQEFGAFPPGVAPAPPNQPPLKPSSRKSVLFPAHRAMLLRSEFFAAMFSSPFREAQEKEYLQIIPVDCNPAVLEIVLTFLYTEAAIIPLEHAIDTLFAADLLFIEKLKSKAAMIISTLGNGPASVVEAGNARGETGEEEVLDIYEVVRAGWATREHRLEEFGARYIAYRLERYIQEEEFGVLVRESAARIKERQETDTVELIDDIRYYLSERFRLRFEDAGLDEMMNEEAGQEPGGPSATSKSQSLPDDEAVDISTPTDPTNQDGDEDESHAPDLSGGAIRTLDGELAGDEFAQDAVNYQILLREIDRLLERLRLDA